MVATFTCRLLYEFLCSLLIADVTLTSTAFLSVPKDSVAVVGARVLLECRTSRLNLSLRWSYYASNNPKRLVSLYNGRSVSNAFASNYEVDAIPDSGSYNLIIKSAGFPCAGEYTCSEDPFAQNATVAFLTVLASDPVCDTNLKHVIHGMPKVENDELWAWCTVTFIGKGIPRIKWTFDSAGIVKPNETVTVNPTGFVSTFTSMIKMQVNFSAYGRPVNIRCKTIFEIQELPERLHYNQTLNYEYTWNNTANALYEQRYLKTTTHLYVNGVTDEHTKSTSLNNAFDVTAFTEDINEVESPSTLNLLVTVIVPSTVALIFVLIIAILLAKRECCKATERHISVDGNQEVSEADTQPIIQMETQINPYSEVGANMYAACPSMEPGESLGAGPVARQGHTRRSAKSVEPREGLYSELTARLSHAQGNQEKELYTPLRPVISAPGNSEHSDYIEIL